MEHTYEEKLAAFGRLLRVLDELREKCPWDRKQTNESLRPNTIEETYELCDALAKDDALNICKELGDVLLHIAFYAKIGSEQGRFDIADVCNKLCDKLIFRHPHVFPPEGEEMQAAAQAVKRPRRCAHGSAHAHQGISHSGQGPQCGLRLGRAQPSVGQGEGGNLGV